MTRKEVSSKTTLCPLCKSTDISAVGFPNPKDLICNRCALVFNKTRKPLITNTCVFFFKSSRLFIRKGRSWETLSNYVLKREAETRGLF